jgi:hypothetical protein
LERLLNRCGVGEFNVSETTALACIAVHLYARGNDLTALLEFGLEPIIVHVPREAANENRPCRWVISFGSSIAIGKFFLFGRRGHFRICFALA